MYISSVLVVYSPLVAPLVSKSNPVKTILSTSTGIKVLACTTVNLISKKAASSPASLSLKCVAITVFATVIQAPAFNSSYSLSSAVISAKTSNA